MEVVVLYIVKVYQPNDVEVVFAVLLYLYIDTIAQIVIELIVRVYHVLTCIVLAEVGCYLC